MYVNINFYHLLMNGLQTGTGRGSHGSSNGTPGRGWSDALRRRGHTRCPGGPPRSAIGVKVSSSSGSRDLPQSSSSDARATVSSVSVDSELGSSKDDAENGKSGQVCGKRALEASSRDICKADVPSGFRARSKTDGPTTPILEQEGGLESDEERQSDDLSEESDLLYSRGRRDVCRVKREDGTVQVLQWRDDDVDPEDHTALAQWLDDVGGFED